MRKILNYFCYRVLGADWQDIIWFISNVVRRVWFRNCRIHGPERAYSNSLIPKPLLPNHIHGYTTRVRWTENPLQVPAYKSFPFYHYILSK